VPGELVGDRLLVDPLRALPRSMTYDAQLHQDGVSYDTLVTVQSILGPVHIDSELPTKDGPATVDFLRRRD
jgi:hypothetical protein